MSTLGTHSPTEVGNRGRSAEAESPKRVDTNATWARTVHTGQMRRAQPAEAVGRESHEHLRARRIPTARVSVLEAGRTMATSG
eukprot:11210886-Lingulodinium_polyedra.AAC.1